MAEKFYAVKVGKTPGVYRSWEDCKAMVHGYPGAVYKSFSMLAEAEAFAGVSGVTGTVSDEMPDLPDIYAFVDGSYNTVTGVYGYGGFLVHHGEKEILQGCGEEPEMASMNNVAGEVLGSMAAIRRAVELGLPELTVFYDYVGIEMWATGNWKRNKTGTIAYHEYIRSVQGQIQLKFVKVEAHTGVPGNEEADRLAKEAVGIGIETE